MKPAICTSIDYALPFDRVVPLIREAGFEVVSLGANPQHSDFTTPAGRKVIRQLLQASRLTVDSVHAPFPEGDRLFALEESARQESLRQCQSALDAAVELASPIVVIHLIQPYGIPPGEERQAMIERGRQSVGWLAEQAARRGVKLALENGQERAYDEVLASLLGEFAGEHVGFCYDSGHENVQGTCFRLLEEFGDRLLTVHLHDNHGSDTHVLPYEGTINWEEFRQVRRRLDYAGNLLLEVSMAHSQYQDPVVFLAEARARAERLLA